MTSLPEPILMAIGHLGSGADTPFTKKTLDPALAPAADAAALTMVALVFFLLGCFATLAVTLHRRSRRPPPWHADLTGGTHPQHRDDPPNAASSRPEPEPWEREADWWRRDS